MTEKRILKPEDRYHPIGKIPDCRNPVTTMTDTTTDTLPVLMNKLATTAEQTIGRDDVPPKIQRMALGILEWVQTSRRKAARENLRRLAAMSTEGV